MRSYSRKHITLAAALTVSISQAAWAGKLGVNFEQVSPTKAFVYCLAFPGGGHYYLSKLDPVYRRKFYFFLGLGIASGVLLYTQTRVENNPMLVPTFLVVGGLKLWEFGSAVDDTEQERLKWLEKHFQLKPGEGLSRIPVEEIGNR